MQSYLTGGTKERIAQSKRARAGSLAIVNWPQVARTCIPWAFGLQMSCRLSLALRLFGFVSVFILSLKPRPFVQSFFDMQAPRQPHVFLPFFLLILWRCVAFSESFCTIAVFSLYGEYVVRYFLPNGVFLPCDDALDVFTSINQSIKISITFSRVYQKNVPARVANKGKLIEGTLLASGNSV